MHPLVARLHPALRTAVVAWLTSRVIIWSAAPSKTLVVADGSPLSGLTAAALDAISATPGPWSQLTMAAPWIVLEVVLLVAGIAVYRFARSTDLPQLAERACWLWFFNPVLAISAGDWGAQMAVACGALAIAGVAIHHPRRAALAALVATGCRLEFVILWPAMAIAAWHHRRDKRHGPVSTAMAIGAIPVAFITWIAITLYLAGSANTSLRSVHGEALWRESLSLGAASSTDMVLMALAAILAAIAFGSARRFPLWYLLAALPPVAWLFLKVPASAAAVPLTWALPLFVYVAAATDDRSIERPLMVAMAVAFTAIAFAPG